MGYSPGQPISAEETMPTVAWLQVNLSHVGWSLRLVLEVTHVGTVHQNPSFNEGMSQVHLKLRPTILLGALVPGVKLILSHVLCYEEHSKQCRIKHPEEHSHVPS